MENFRETLRLAHGGRSRCVAWFGLGCGCPMWRVAIIISTSIPKESSRRGMVASDLFASLRVEGSADWRCVTDVDMSSLHSMGSEPDDHDTNEEE